MEHMEPQSHPSDRFSKAVVFACKKHEGHTRDDKQTPYAVHPIRVCEHLRRIAGEEDESVLCAALLHDTIEDAAVTFDNIASTFGEDVAALVSELTNDNRLPKARRRSEMMEKLNKLSPRAKRIKLADRLDNVLDLVNGMGAPEKHVRYADETARLLTACAGACKPLEDTLKDALEKLRQMNAQMFDRS
jgi:guanosine-3',5'-bis(diphosphate) 3'-pyrophosphohydrolase